VPIYPFTCDACGAEFEVMRKVAAAKDPAACPACGTDARRVFTGVAVNGSVRRTAGDPSSASTEKRQASSGGTSGWTHSGHSHGAGTDAHTHGMWQQPTVPASGREG